MQTANKYFVGIIIFIYFIFQSVPSIAQKRMNNPQIPEIDIYWQVVVNKDNVSLYTDPNLRNRDSKKANFCEHFYVVDTSLYGYQIEVKSREFWIAKEDVLPTFFCQRIGKSKLSVKASLVSYLEDKPADGALTEYYSAPHGSKKKRGEARFYDFYFVYDTYPHGTSTDSATKLLLGTSPRFSYLLGDSHADQILMGWVDATDFIIWKTRLALGPNLSTTAIEEKKRKGIYASILTNSGDARRFASGSRPSRSPFSTDKDFVDNKAQLNPTSYRFPILHSRKNVLLRDPNKTVVNRHEIAFVGNIYGQEKLDRSIEEANSFNKVDVLFVVDASASMGRYINTLPRAITQAVSDLKDRFSTKFDWSLVTFKNQKDFNSGYQHHGTTSDPNLLKNWVEKISFSSVEKVKLREDMFYGTMRALDETFTGQEKESIRIVFVISDVSGAERSGSSYSYNSIDLGQKLKFYDTHFISMNVGNTYYSEYKTQMQKVIQVMNSHSYSLSEHSTNSSSGHIYYAKENYGQGMNACFVDVRNPRTYSILITDAIRYVAAQLAIDNREEIKGVDDDGSSFLLTKERFTFTFPFQFNIEYRKKKLDFTDKAINVRFVKGHVINFHPELDHTPFVPTILLSQPEIDRLGHFFTTIADQLNSSNPDARVMDAITMLLKNHTGEIELIDDVSAYLNSVGEEIPMVSTFLEDFSKKRSITNPHDQQRIAQEFMTKGNDIKRLYNKMSNYPNKETFKIGIEKYRWVPLSLIP